MAKHFANIYKSYHFKILLHFYLQTDLEVFISCRKQAYMLDSVHTIQNNWIYLRATFSYRVGNVIFCYKYRALIN